MQALIEVILPVFMVVGAGYLAVWSGYFGDTLVDEGGSVGYTLSLAGVLQTGETASVVLSLSNVVSLQNNEGTECTVMTVVIRVRALDRQR